MTRRVRLGLATALAIGGAVAIVPGSPAAAVDIQTGNADQECQAAGFDYGVKLQSNSAGTYVYDTIGSWEPTGLSLALEVTIEDGHNFSFTAAPAVDGVLAKAGTDYQLFAGGTEGDITISGQQSISHLTFCYDEGEQESISVTKTVNTAYDLTHHWSLDKSVDQTDVTLAEDDTGTVNWTIDVGYEGASESGHTVSGQIAVENTGAAAAAISGVADTMTIEGNPTAVTVDCGVDFGAGPVFLDPGATLVCTYSHPVDGQVDGSNTATATSALGNTYDSDPVGIVWGAPETVTDATVDLTDISDVNGASGPTTFTAPTGGQVAYSNTFDWAEYDLPSECGIHTYDNTATLDITAGDDLTDSGSVTVEVECDPDTDIDKQLVGDATLDPETGVWTVAYDVTVTNSGPGAATVDVEDELMFGAGVVVQSVGVTNDGGYSTNSDFDGGSGVNGGNTYIIEGAVLDGAGETPTKVTFTVTVTATIPTPVLGAGACDADGEQNGGFLNVAWLHEGGVITGPVHDCDPFSTLRLVKNVVNDDGGTARPNDFALIASDGGVTFLEGSGDVIAAVPAGTYDLSESTDTAGYTSAADGFVCSTQQTGDRVTVPQAADVSCTITNHDDPVVVTQLVIEKTASTSSLTAGDSFEYEIDVTNVSTAGAADPVTLADPIPSNLRVDSIDTSTTLSPRWVDCEVSGKAADGFGGTLHCDLLGPLPAGASAPTVTLGVTVRPTVGSTSITNTAVVEWSLAGDPEQTGTDDDSAVVTVTGVESRPPTPSVPTLPPTGGSLPGFMASVALLAVGAGALLLLAGRRRTIHR